MSSLNPNSVMEYVTFLLTLFESKDWIAFDEIVLSNPKTFKFISKTISECEEFNGMTLVHACVRYDPPVHVLSQMVNLYPKAVEQEDCLGRTPLHVAAGCSADPQSAY